MKIKPLHIYVLGIIIVIAIIIFSTTGNKEQPTSSKDLQSEMPKDDIHKNLMQDNKTPSKSNVSEGFKQRMEGLKKSIEENPNDTTALKEYAMLLIASHKPSEAIEYLERILKQDPTKIEIMLELTAAYYNMSEFDKALATTNKILELDKDRTEAVYNLGAIAAAKGDLDKAKEIWSGLVQKYPGTRAAEIAKSALDKLK